MNLTVECLSEIAAESVSHVVESALDIFYETSAKSDFKNQQERIDFEWKYFRSYLENPDLVLFARRQKKILGYLVGTLATTPEHFVLNPYLFEFKSEIDHRFPSHLHINLTEDARGLGIGSRLISAFENRLREAGSFGVHIVTSATARNVHFYSQNGFESIQTAEKGDSKILLMGKRLKN
jgi:ribosomal protein S18 acetylase RimI-like enzyme